MTEVKTPQVVKTNGATAAGEVMIREFAPGDEIAFRSLNEEWISRYFVLESEDNEILANPQSAILDGGGRIFLAVQDGRAIGCCALIATGPSEFQVAKMAVTESSQGRGIGRRLLETVIDHARALGVKRLHLGSNSQLTPAIHLYESLGFQHLPTERIPPSVYARANTFMELTFE